MSLISLSVSTYDITYLYIIKTLAYTIHMFNYLQGKGALSIYGLCTSEMMNFFTALNSKSL